MAHLEETPCCGVQFIDSIQDETPKETLLAVCAKKYEDGENEWGDYSDPWEQAFLVFTDNVSDSDYGNKLAKYITEHKLGGVKATRQRRNPNTTNMIKVWVWTPNERNLKKWYNKHN